MLTPFKTYCKLQVSIFCVFPRSDILGTILCSYVSKFVIFSWLIFFVFEYFDISMHLWMCQIFFFAFAPLMCAFCALILGSLLVAFMVLSNLNTSTELSKMASVEKNLKITRRPGACWTHRKYRDYNKLCPWVSSMYRNHRGCKLSLWFHGHKGLSLFHHRTKRLRALKEKI